MKIYELQALRGLILLNVPRLRAKPDGELWSQEGIEELQLLDRATLDLIRAIGDVQRLWHALAAERAQQHPTNPPVQPT